MLLLVLLLLKSEGQTTTLQLLVHMLLIKIKDVKLTLSRLRNPYLNLCDCL